MTKYKARRKPPIPMVRVTESDSPVIDIINCGMDMTVDKTMMALSHNIEYAFSNLWCVYHRQRNMPIGALWRLCQFVGIDAKTCIELHEAQPPVPRVKTKDEEDPEMDGFDPG